MMSIRNKLILNCYRDIFHNKSRINWFHTSATRWKQQEDEIVIPKDSHYSVLGVKPTATQEEIKSEYFKLSKIYHPDVNSSDESLSKFQKLAAAYTVIGDVKTRDEYDKKVLGIKRVVVSDESKPTGSTTRVFFDFEDDVDYTDNVYRQKQKDKAKKKERVQWVPPGSSYQDTYIDPMDDDETIDAKQRVILQKIRLKERQNPKKSGNFVHQESPAVDYDPYTFFTDGVPPPPGVMASSSNIRGGYFDPEFKSGDAHFDESTPRMMLLFVIPVAFFALYKVITSNYLGFMDTGEVMQMERVRRKVDGFPTSDNVR